MCIRIQRCKFVYQGTEDQTVQWYKTYVTQIYTTLTDNNGGSVYREDTIRLFTFLHNLVKVFDKKSAKLSVVETQTLINTWSYFMEKDRNLMVPKSKL